jgi:hypothetical protein
MTVLRIPESYWDNLGGKQNHRAFKTKKPRANLEHKFQARLVRDIRRVNPAALFFAVPNSGYRHIYAATKFKAEGVVSGTPDLVFVLDSAAERGRVAFLELKAPKGSLSENQKIFRDRAYKAGAFWEFAKDFDTAWGVLAGWGVVPSGVGA